MAFIRKKKINGKEFYYLVENKRINGKVKQKVLAYFGMCRYIKSEITIKSLIEDLKRQINNCQGIIDNDKIWLERENSTRFIKYQMEINNGIVPKASGNGHMKRNVSLNKYWGRIETINKYEKIVIELNNKLGLLQKM